MDLAAFWEIMGLLNWDKEGDDDEVLLPLIEKLVDMTDDEIFAFDDIMAKLLYDIDGCAWAKAMYDDLNDISGDEFLYARCVAIVNGKDYYENIKNHTEIMDPDLEFEAILYVPPIAWAVKHDGDVEEYPHNTKYSFETGSNTKQWGAEEA